MTDWDAIVVGAGPAGSATAAHLAMAGRSVLLVDKARFPRDKPCAEYASPETEPVLRRLGIWPALQSAGIRRLRGMIIVAPNGERFHSEYLDGCQRRYSLAVRRLLLDNLLLEHASSSGAECRLGLRVQAPIIEARRVVGVRATRADRSSEMIRARIVVGADGLRSQLARALGGGHSAVWPRRLGLSARYRGLAGRSEWGEMYVGRGGYCGLAPTDDDETTVAAALPLRRLNDAHLTARKLKAGAGVASRDWRADHSDAWGQSNASRPQQRLRRAVADHPSLIGRLARAEQISPFRGAGPLAWHVPRVAGPGFLLVGDAAGFFDPFTGEGIFRALRGAELAAEAVQRVLCDSDWLALAARYDQMRRAAFSGKERLARLIQVFVRCPPLLGYALSRLERRPELAERLSAALGDFGSPTIPVQPGYLVRLLRA